MDGGFSFCGHDISECGLEYAPEMENTYVYAPAEASIHETTYEGHNGGYEFGYSLQPKEFILRCFFEEKQIDRGIMTRIYNLFKPGRSGKLVFKRRPWCYYYATVTSNPKPEFTNYLNGTVTITMKAYYPYARYDSFDNAEKHLFYNAWEDLYHDNIMQNTGLFEKEEMVPDLTLTNLTESSPILNKPILLPNPGTERAKVGIAIAGDAVDGITIANRTTQQECKFVLITKALTTNVGKEVYCDGLNGKTVLRGNGESNISFMFHDSGFIELEPSYPAIRNVYASYKKNNNQIEILNNIEQNVVGKYIFIINKWHKINVQSGNTLTVDETISANGEEKTIISSMNEIYISAPTMSIDRISFTYRPTFA